MVKNYEEQWLRLLLTLHDVLCAVVISSYQPHIILIYDFGFNKTVDDALVGRCTKP